ncbi:MAG: hypothetical protein ABL998_09475 [Planctomycetota bacterium]
MAPLSKPDPTATVPHLRLVEDAASAPAPHGAWTLHLVALSASAGHGLFLATALTRLRSLPSRAELGGVLEMAVLGWFVASVPLLALALATRARFLRLTPARAAQVAALSTGLSVLAFALYLRAVAL